MASLHKRKVLTAQENLACMYEEQIKVDNSLSFHIYESSKGSRTAVCVYFYIWKMFCQQCKACDVENANQMDTA